MHMNRIRVGVALTALSALALAACGGGGFEEDGDGGGGGGTGSLRVVIGSSGDAETDAVNAAVNAWSEDSGIPVTVTPASDLVQQLSQGFASGDPADVFYVSLDQFQGWAANGSLLPYAGDLSNVDDFYPSLVNSFTFEDEFYCAPKDFSTLALIINTDAWAAANLTDADIPTTWDALADVAARLTTDSQRGLVFSGEYARIGVFMAQAGGSLISEDGTTATASSPENVEALTWVKDQLNTGNVAYATDVGTGWGGEAFGRQLAAMTIEGNWITGAMNADYPDVNYVVAELPSGPAGQGTLQFTNCWGIATDSRNHDDSIALVEFLTSTDQQLAFAEAFGVMPSVETAADGWLGLFPEQGAFLAGADYAHDVVSAAGSSAVITDFNAQLEGLRTGDPQAILDSVQRNLQAVLDENA